MEINIKKFQAGGYLTYQPLPMQEQPQQAAPTQTAASEQDNGIDNDVMDKLLGKGITNDVMAYTQAVSSAYKQYSVMSIAERNTYKGRQMRNMMKGDPGQLNALVRAKEAFDKSADTAKTNGALDEMAATDTGVVVKTADGKLDIISFSKIAQDNSKEDKGYQILTNADLITEREMNGKLVGNDRIFSVLNSAKGMEKVKEEISKIISIVKSSSKSVVNGSYQGLDAQGAENLEGAAAAGAFKVKDSGSIESNAPQIEKAKQAMWINLSPSAKNTLRARASATVTDPSKIETVAMTMAASLLDPASYSKTTEIHDVTKSKDKNGAGGGSGSAGRQLAVGPLEAAYSGLANRVDMSTIGAGMGAKLQGVGYVISPTAYTTKDGGTTSLEAAAKLKEISYLAQAFTMNGDKVTPKNTVITGDVYRSKMPVTQGPNGVLKVDEQAVGRVAQFNEELASLPHNLRTNLKESELKAKYGLTNIVMRDVLVAEVSSIRDGYWDNRDEKYYNPIDDATRELIDSIIDPKSDNVNNMLNNNAEKHLVFIPMRDESSFRYADGNNMEAPAAAFQVDQFNRGVGGAGVAEGYKPYADNSTTINNKDLSASGYFK